MTTQNSRTIHCVNLKFLLFVGSVFCVFMMWFVAPGRNPQKVGLMKQTKQSHPSLLAAAALQWRRPGSLPPWRPLWSGAWPRHDGRWHVLGESCMFWCARTCHHFQSTRRVGLSDRSRRQLQLDDRLSRDYVRIRNIARPARRDTVSSRQATACTLTKWTYVR